MENKLYPIDEFEDLNVYGYCWIAIHSIPAQLYLAYYDYNVFYRDDTKRVSFDKCQISYVLPITNTEHIEEIR